MEWEPIPLEDVDAARRRRRRLWAVALLAVAALGALVVVGTGGGDESEDVAADTRSSTTSTTIDPRRDPELEARLSLRQACRLQDNFTIAATSLNPESDPVILHNAADLMIEALKELRRVQAYPELSALAETLQPVVEEIAAQLSPDMGDDVIPRLAADPRFAEGSELYDTTMRIIEYPLECE
jgi:hypothetical protein